MCRSTLNQKGKRWCSASLGNAHHTGPKLLTKGPRILRHGNPIDSAVAPQTGPPVSYVTVLGSTLGGKQSHIATPTLLNSSPCLSFHTANLLMTIELRNGSATPGHTPVCMYVA